MKSNTQASAISKINNQLQNLYKNITSILLTNIVIILVMVTIIQLSLSIDKDENGIGFLVVYILFSYLGIVYFCLLNIMLGLGYIANIANAKILKKIINAGLLLMIFGLLILYTYNLIVDITRNIGH